MVSETQQAAVRIDPRQSDAVIFDMDGVVTDTVPQHLVAWTRLFNDYLAERARRTGEPFREFEETDYFELVDGRPREDGVAAFLASRGIDIPHGTADDDEACETVIGLGRRKNGYFRRTLAAGVRAYPSTVSFVKALHRAGIPSAVISASRNAGDVLAAAGVSDLFRVQVDGTVAAQLGLAGKPDPAVFLEAARRLGAQPLRSAVVEDAVAGVQAGRRGGFGLVIGVDRTGHGDALLRAGADVVVADLGEATVGEAVT